jgi:hypothetical protein
LKKPKKRWSDDAENDLKKMGVRGLRKIAKARDAWKLILKETRIVCGSQSQCRHSVLVVMACGLVRTKPILLT